MLPADAELYRRVDEIVHYIWDPIGVAGSPGARDEYYGYLVAIFGRVQKGDLSGIVEYMRYIVTECMGLLFDKDVAEKAASLMLEWKQKIESNT